MIKHRLNRADVRPDVPEPEPSPYSVTVLQARLQFISPTPAELSGKFDTLTAMHPSLPAPPLDVVGTISALNAPTCE